MSIMSSKGLWACCLLLIGYKDGSLLRENLNFLMVNARDYFGLVDLLHLVSISNELYNSGLLSSTYLKIISLKVHYSIEREFFHTTSQTPWLYSCKQKPQEKQGRICKQKPEEKPWEDIYSTPAIRSFTTSQVLWITAGKLAFACLPIPVLGWGIMLVHGCENIAGKLRQKW